MGSLLSVKERFSCIKLCIQNRHGQQRDLGLS